MAGNTAPEPAFFDVAIVGAGMAGASLAFELAPHLRVLLLTWSMAGENSFVAKAVTLIMNCDKMVGGQYEKGLAEIKSLSEAAVKK